MSHQAVQLHDASNFWKQWAFRHDPCIVRAETLSARCNYSSYCLVGVMRLLERYTDKFKMKYIFEIFLEPHSAPARSTNLVLAESQRFTTPQQTAQGFCDHRPLRPESTTRKHKHAAKDLQCKHLRRALSSQTMLPPILNLSKWRFGPGRDMIRRASCYEILWRVYAWQLR